MSRFLSFLVLLFPIAATAEAQEQLPPLGCTGAEAYVPDRQEEWVPASRPARSGAAGLAPDPRGLEHGPGQLRAPRRLMTGRA